MQAEEVVVMFRKALSGKGMSLVQAPDHDLAALALQQLEASALLTHHLYCSTYRQTK